MTSSEQERKKIIQEDSSEEQRIKNEEERIVNEDKRLNAEEVRRNNEIKRQDGQGDAEKNERERQENEKQRITNEKERIKNEGDREQEQKQRNDYEEIVIKPEEAERELNEGKRKEAEEIRKKAEIKREENQKERQEQEESRQKQEKDRKANEESRQKEEKQREVNEEKRKEKEREQELEEEKRREDEDKRKEEEQKRREAERKRQKESTQEKELYSRPNIPYLNKNTVYNNRYQLKSINKEALSAEELDGDLNYLIDSINELYFVMKEAVINGIDGVDKEENINKFLICKDIGEIGWELISGKSIAFQTIEARNIKDSIIDNKKIAEGAVTNEKIKNNTIEVNKIYQFYTDDEEREKIYQGWGRKIGSVDNVSESLVRRNRDNIINVKGIHFDAKYEVKKSDKLKDEEKPDISKYWVAGAKNEKEDFKPVELGKFIYDFIEENFDKRIDEQFNKDHPIGSLSFTPLRQGDKINDKEIKWELLKDARVLTTSLVDDCIQQKEAGGTNIIGNDGKTEEHVLTIDEMPSHNHNVPWDRCREEDKLPYWRIKVKGDTNKSSGITIGGNKDIFKPIGGWINLDTKYNGSDKPHSHKIDVKRLEVTIYRRAS